MKLLDCIGKVKDLLPEELHVTPALFDEFWAEACALSGSVRQGVRLLEVSTEDGVISVYPDWRLADGHAYIVRKIDF